MINNDITDVSTINDCSYTKITRKQRNKTNEQND